MKLGRCSCNRCSRCLHVHAKQKAEKLLARPGTHTTAVACSRTNPAHDHAHATASPLVSEARRSRSRASRSSSTSKQHGGLARLPSEAFVCRAQASDRVRLGSTYRMFDYIARDTTPHRSITCSLRHKLYRLLVYSRI